MVNATGRRTTLFNTFVLLKLHDYLSLKFELSSQFYIVLFCNVMIYVILSGFLMHGDVELDMLSNMTIYQY